MCDVFDGQTGAQSLDFGYILSVEVVGISPVAGVQQVKFCQVFFNIVLGSVIICRKLGYAHGFAFLGDIVSIYALHVTVSRS